ncbi:MFS transporter [Nocardioides jishulii]|uniref:MFS transporter n=1 Tax=Nocardioides jishulii TaxID=2575440 RepID=A0A4U2YTS1_9ACTN|nr:MFS transporter [Nocardioides jishulii]QCX28828.1 MFS transporter [Nocardioides jishulii]TKI64275.1 MFS transporter [Nocardioides jishulii]
MTTPQTTTQTDQGGGILSPAYLATTLGTFAVIVLVAFENLAVTTVMPTLTDALDGRDLYALGFAAPLASGVVGMVAAGMISDRRGPAMPLLLALSVFAGGLLMAGAATSMELFVAGRVLQGLGGGGATVVLYVVIGLIYPSRLQASVFAALAAAWVLPSLFGPAVAAVISEAFGWRWVFLGTVALVAVVGLGLARRVLGLPQPEQQPEHTSYAPLVWAVVAAAAVLGVRLVGDNVVLALACAALVLFALTHLLPKGALRLAEGLPSVISTRGFLAGSFFMAEGYVVLTLEEKWGLTPTVAGLALSAVGIVWALTSWLQARMRRLGHTRAMTVGAFVIVAGLVLLTGAIWLEVNPWIAGAVYVVAGAGMGFAYPRTGVAMLQASTDVDRGFNSAALNAADSMGGALSLALAGLVFATVESAGGDPFTAVYCFASAVAVVSVLAAARTNAHGTPDGAAH